MIPALPASIVEITALGTLIYILYKDIQRRRTKP